jgi:membrane associated rhomboid family serine protease
MAFLPLYDHNRLRYITRPYATWTLILINVIAFFATGGFNEYAVQVSAVGLGFVPSMANGYEVRPESFVVPQAATYVTYAFLHANWLHLVGNMLFLWVFGDNIEDALGHLRYVIFYFACVAAAAVVYSAAFPNSPTPLAGASGAAAGIAGGYLVLHPRVKVWILALWRLPLRISAIWVLGAWALLQVYNVIVAGSQAVGWWAHVGGLVAGAVLVVVLRRRGVPLFDRNTPETG